ncbi:histidinol-phosphate transaminase [Luteimonas sp. e5]
MSTAERVLRSDLRDFSGYVSAARQAVHGETWLNANEAATASLADADERCRRYPPPQPAALVGALAALYGVQPAQLLATRGSDEGIDLLLRAFCPPGAGAIVIAPPVFGMYAVCARLHGSRVIEVPARRGRSGWHSDLHAMAQAARDTGASLVFVCNPGNPTGECIDTDAITALAHSLQGQALVVLDAAYAEFADAFPDMAPLLDAHDNLVILRTLSKAHALAGARIGSVLADPGIVRILQRCQVPYPLPAPAVSLALDALQPAALAATRARAADCKMQRSRMLEALTAQPGVARVWPSQGNFLLVEFEQPQAAFDALLAAGVVVRDMRSQPGCERALRISIGRRTDNARVLAALATLAERAA